MRKVLNFDSYKQDGSLSAARQWILVNILWKMRFLENETIFISFIFMSKICQYVIFIGDPYENDALGDDIGV